MANEKTQSEKQMEDILAVLQGNFERDFNFQPMHNFDPRHFNINISDPNAVKSYLANMHGAVLNMAARQQQGSNGLLKNNPETINSLKVNAVGIATLQVTRTTANIAVPLPYPLFGYTAYQGNYQSVLRNYVPAGLTWTSTTDATTGDVLITYTNSTPVSDIIRIHFATNGTTTYSDLLVNSSARYFKSKYTLYSISDYTNGQAQFKNTIAFGNVSALGNKNTDTVSLDAFIDTVDFRYDRANFLYGETPLNDQFAFVDYIIPCPTPDLVADGGLGFIVNWNIFMSSKHGY